MSFFSQSMQNPNVPLFWPTLPSVLLGAKGRTRWKNICFSVIIGANLRDRGNLARGMPLLIGYLPE